MVDQLLVEALDRFILHWEIERINNHNVYTAHVGNPTWSIYFRTEPGTAFLEQFLTGRWQPISLDDAINLLYSKRTKITEEVFVW